MVMSSSQTELVLGPEVSADAIEVDSEETMERRPNPAQNALEVSVIFPCLNEEAAIGACVSEALLALQRCGAKGEVLVVDNGSKDRSAEIAERSGARVIKEDRRGYGSAYLRGIQEARGEYLIMLDADGTYPIEQIPEFLDKLKEAGNDFVVGNRFCDRMNQNAMPWLNRYVGNPILSGMTRLLYRVGIKDIHCGMRAVRRSALEPLHLMSPGMEFATEMIVKALDHGLKFSQLDIAYRPRVGETKLRRLRDAWRHVEYMLIFSPSLLFLIPGSILFLFGLSVQLLLLHGPQRIFFRTWGIHTNLAGLASSLTGITLLVLGIVSCSAAWSAHFRFRHSWTSRLVVSMGNRWPRAIGALLLLSGLALWLKIVIHWSLSGFGELSALPILSLATTLLSSGLALVGASFLVNLLTVKR